MALSIYLTEHKHTRKQYAIVYNYYFLIFKIRPRARGQKSRGLGGGADNPKTEVVAPNDWRMIPVAKGGTVPGIVVPRTAPQEAVVPIPS